MDLINRDRKYVWHPFTSQKSMPDPLPIIRAEGSLLFDESGNAYIDAISSWWVTLHGHSHPYIAEKIYRQALLLEQVIFAGFTHKPAVDLAESLVQMLPAGFSKVFFSDNGSTSTEVALKMAIQFWWNGKNLPYESNTPGRNKILALKNAYHGDTFGAMSVSDRGVFTLAFHNFLFEVVFIEAPSKDNIDSLKEIIQLEAASLAAFVYEPVIQGAGGMKTYDPICMNELLRLIKQNNIICIADEVMTGFGRTGKMFASEYLQTPDIICLSKGLTGGTMALGATVCNEKIYKAYFTDDKLKTFFHGHSFTANPLACTAALASLDLLKQPATLEKIEWLSAKNKNFCEHLNQMFSNENFKPYKNLRCLGTILAFELAEGEDEYLNTVSHIITQKSLENGIYLRPLGNTVYIMPPYSITDAELEKVYKFLLFLIKDWKEKKDEFLLTGL